MPPSSVACRPALHKCKWVRGSWSTRNSLQRRRVTSATQEWKNKQTRSRRLRPNLQCYACLPKGLYVQRRARSSAGSLSPSGLSGHTHLANPRRLTWFMLQPCRGLFLSPRALGKLVIIVILLNLRVKVYSQASNLTLKRKISERTRAARISFGVGLLNPNSLQQTTPTLQEKKPPSLTFYPALLADKVWFYDGTSHNPNSPKN